MRGVMKVERVQCTVITVIVAADNISSPSPLFFRSEDDDIAPVSIS